MPGTKKAAPPPPTLEELLAGDEPVETTVAVCMRASLQARFEDLERQLTDLADRPRERLNADPLTAEAKRLAEEIEQVREDMKRHTLIVRFRDFGHVRWTTLWAEHPPREGNKEDQQVGHNADTFYRALVREAMCAPEMTDEQFATFERKRSSYQWDELVDGALRATRRRVDVPKSRLSSAILRRSDGT